MEKSSIHVLVVEDKAGVAKIIKGALSSSDSFTYEVHHADTLSAALARLVQGGIDVILMDLGLPDSDGLETFQKVFAQAPSLPIVVLTGLGDDLTGAKAVEAGAQDYLVKGQMDIMALPRTLMFAIERSKKRKS